MDRFINVGRSFLGVCLLLLACCSAALGIQPYPSQQVALGWTASPDSTVKGYYIYYGLSSSGCTNRINAGTNTQFTVSGLESGLTYYFSATSYNAAGMESSYVSEISYLVPGLLVLAQNPTNGALRIQFSVAIGGVYALQASSDLKSWGELWLTPAQTSNDWIEYDEPVTNTVAARFYRLIINPP
jgi:hypothetical protein